MRGLMRYGKRDKGIDTAILTFIFLLFSLVYISNSGVLQASQTQEQVATSHVIPDYALGFFRIACCILAIVTLSWIALNPKGSEDYPLFLKERRIKLRKVVGPTRLAAFTMWHFALIGLYYGVSGASTWIHSSGGTVPDWIVISSPILFSTSFAAAILVTCVISFHIIPKNLERGLPVFRLFTWYEIVMHNGNVALLGASLLVNGIQVEWKFIAFPVVFGIAYVAWAAIYANFISGVFIYDFMDYRLQGAPLIYLGLLTLQATFFLVVLGLDRLVETSSMLGALVIMAMTWTIIRIRDPSHG